MLGNKWIKDVECGASKQEKRKIHGYSEGGQRVGGSILSISAENLSVLLFHFSKVIIGSIDCFKCYFSSSNTPELWQPTCMSCRVQNRLLVWHIYVTDRTLNSCYSE